MSEIPSIFAYIITYSVNMVRYFTDVRGGGGGGGGRQGKPKCMVLFLFLSEAIQK